MPRKYSTRTVLGSLAWAVVCGVLASVSTGLMENPPRASIVGARYYGYPLFWRMTLTLQPDRIQYTNLIIDMGCWLAICFVALIIVQGIFSTRCIRTKD